MTERQSDKWAREVPGDIKLAAGTTYVVCIDTDSYSGNFERQMAAFAAGAFDEDRYHGEDQLAEFEEAAENDPMLAAIKDKVVCVTHEEYGEVTNTIWPTPGRINNGMGGHADDVGQEGYPAYESVAIFFDEALTNEELDVIKARATEYGINGLKFGRKVDLIVVTGIRLLTYEVEHKVSIKQR